jgi:hypothetical protein
LTEIAFLLLQACAVEYMASDDVCVPNVQFATVKYDTEHAVDVAVHMQRTNGKE